MRLSIFALSSLLAASLTAAAQEPAASAPVEIPVAIGQSVKEIRVPHHNAQGQLSLRLNAAQAERSSSTEFLFDELRIEIFDEQAEKPALEVIMPEAVFDQATRRLASSRRSVIKGESVEITGRELEFDIDTRTSRLRGPVTMVVNAGEATLP
jgi:hypothetical protein